MYDEKIVGVFECCRTLIFIEFISSGGNQSKAIIKYNENLRILQAIERIIFDLNEENIDQSVESSFQYFSQKFPISFLHIISRIIYSYFVSKGFEKLCIKYLQKAEIKSNNILINVVTQFLLSINNEESNYLLEKMIESKLIEPKIVQNKNNPFYIHYVSEEEFIKLQPQMFKFKNENNFKDLSENFELHKKYIKEGHNPNDIATIIRNDEVEKLQEISSQNNFDFNQTIEPSLYERCSFINKKNVTLIDYAAFFSSVKCFKYLLMNGVNVENTGKYAIAGGNEEIIHLCEQNHSSFYGSLEAAIIFHRNDIFKYIYENKIIPNNNLEELGKECILHDNFNLLSFLKEEGMNINKNHIINSIRTGNIFVFLYFLGNNKISLNFLEISEISIKEEFLDYLINHKYINLKRNV